MIIRHHSSWYVAQKKCTQTQRFSSNEIRVVSMTSQEERCMKCKKCDGLMVLQSFFDHFLNFEGWKCLNCGKIIVKKEKTIEYDSFSIFYQQQKCKNRT